MKRKKAGKISMYSITMAAMMSRIMNTWLKRRRRAMVQIGP